MKNNKRLKEIIPVLAKKHNFGTAIVEKDYYLTVILNNIELHLSNNLVFKGGTLLNKIYLKFNRLSEDLDFTYLSKEELNSRSKRAKAIMPIRENMPKFLRHLGLKSKKPEGDGFNNSTQYIFNILYPSFITGRNENISIEISLRQMPVDRPVYNTINHFYKEPFTGEDLIPSNRILSLSLNEAVAEKLKASITRKDLAIRDYYDLWYIAEAGFDFYDKRFFSIFKKKLKGEGYKGDFKYNFGLSKNAVELLYKQIETDLIPVIKIGRHFELNKVFERFNNILKNLKY